MAGPRDTPPSAPRSRHLPWVGALLTIVGALSYFLYFARFAPLRDVPWVNLPLVLLGLAVAALGLRRAFRPPRHALGRVLALLFFALSLSLAFLFVRYIFWSSYRLPEATPLTLGLDVAPDFALASAAGDVVRLSDLRGRKVVLVFYRGFW